MIAPAWLPPTQSCNGVWNEVVELLHAIFDRDFNSGRPTFRGLPVWWDRTVKAGEVFEGGFWHLISRKDPASGERLPDFRRAERLPWCRPVIDHEREREVLVWEYREGGGQIRTYLWLVDHDYVVVLERQSKRVGKVMFLVTAYHVDGDGRRRHLRRKHAEAGS